MKKNIFICCSPPGKSSPDYNFALGNQLKSHGFDVIYIIDQKWKPSEKIDFEYYVWPNKRPTKIKDFVFYWKLCKKYKPQFTIGNFSSVNITLICGLFAGVKNRFAFVRTLYDQLYYDSQNKIKFKFLNIRKTLIYYFFSTKLLANSHETKLDIIKNNGISENKILVLNNLIYGNTIEYISERKKQFVCIGRLNYSKGQDILIEHFTSLREHFPEYKLLILGNGNTFNTLKSLIDKFSLNDFVILKGTVSLNEVYQTLSESKIHISSSRNEAFGFVNIEAMSSGTPLVGPKIGGIKSIITEKQNGEFYDLFDANSLKTV